MSDSLDSVAAAISETVDIADPANKRVKAAQSDGSQKC